MITMGKNGYYYEFEKPELLIDMMEYAIVHPEKIIAMKNNCLEKAVEYSEEYVMKQIKSEMRI